MSASSHITSLVADVGGTNTRVALVMDGQILPDSIARFRNSEYKELPLVLESYLSNSSIRKCASACIAVAGPVQNGVGQMTNLNWEIDEATLAKVSNAARGRIINDLQAQGFALKNIATNELRTIIGGASKPDSAKLVIGVGTGFNAAPVVEQSGQLIVAASECGHVSLPVKSDEDIRLMRYLSKDTGHASVEDALSGRGLTHLYNWHASEAGMARSEDAAWIMSQMAERENEIAIQAVATFVNLFGRVCGDLALTHLPYGGIYLVGGVIRAMAPYLAEFGFEKSFADKGRMRDVMSDFAIQIVDDDYAALSGCAAYLEAN